MDVLNPNAFKDIVPASKRARCVKIAISLIALIILNMQTRTLINKERKIWKITIQEIL